MTSCKSRPSTPYRLGPGNHLSGCNANEPETGFPMVPSFPDQPHDAGIGSAIDHHCIDRVERWDEPILKEGTQALAILHGQPVCTADEHHCGLGAHTSEGPKYGRQLVAVARPHQSGHVSKSDANLFDMEIAL